MRIASWNINSVRFRLDIVARFLREAQPDVLCLQETKVIDADFPAAAFRELGYDHLLIHGQRMHHGVAIISRVPIVEDDRLDWQANGEARHVGVRLPGGVRLENVYIPAGGDVPDREANPKFGQKLDYLTDMRDSFHAEKPERSILVGDLNIAPMEDDVWSHKAMQKIVSHTPVEIEHLAQAQDAGSWVDVTRKDIPQGKLYSWWSYRARDWDAADKGRRLDHIWATGDIAQAGHASRILRTVRGWDQPSDHVPVFACFDLRV